MPYLPSFFIGIVLGGALIWRTYRPGQPAHLLKTSWLKSRSGDADSLLADTIVADPLTPESPPSDRVLVDPKDEKTLDAEELTVPLHLDRLEQILGIGPTYARRLNQVGILTYADLAALTPDALKAIVSAGNRRDVGFAGWIEQAGQMVTRQAAAEAEAPGKQTGHG